MVGWKEHETGRTHRVLVMELHGKQALGRRNCRWEDNIKTEIVYCLFYDASIIKTLYRRMVRYLMNQELEGVWKEVVVAMLQPRLSLEELSPKMEMFSQDRQYSGQDTT
jgi:hypothetical protein